MSIVDQFRAWRPTLAIAATTMGLGQLQKIVADTMANIGEANELLTERLAEIAALDKQIEEKRAELDRLSQVVESRVNVDEACERIAAVSAELRGLAGQRETPPADRETFTLDDIRDDE